MSELIARHLQKSFKSRMVVNDVSIAIKRGECVGSQWGRQNNVFLYDRWLAIL